MKIWEAIFCYKVVRLRYSAEGKITEILQILFPFG